MVKIEIDGMICETVEKDVTEKVVEFSTCPPDPRFQQQNITRWCYHMFVDFQRCAYYLDENDKNCGYFKKCYLALCPKEWWTKWYEQIDAGVFPRDLTKEMGR